MQQYKKFLLSAIKPYSALLFVNNTSAALFLMAVTFLNPSLALSGVIAVICTIIFAAFLEFDESYLAEGFYIYNSLLVGMGIGFIFTLSWMSVVLIAIASAFTFMFSFMLNRLFSVYKIPILSLPFAIMTVFVYLASLHYSGLLSSIVNNAVMYDIELPLFIGAFFKSFGTIFFLPSHLAGLLMFFITLFFSRIIPLMALSGFYFGVWIHSFFLASYPQALQDPYAFNYILVAIALCGVFLLPTIKNFVLSLIGVAISVVLSDAIGVLFQYYAIPVFTLPFNVTVIVFIFMLSLIYYKEFNTQIQATPEASLANYLSKIFRFGPYLPQIALPFSGEWYVYQAFNGEWTHKGKYRYAYDFVKNKEGKTYKNNGLFLEDYYAFGEAVLAPVSGYIVALRGDLKDNIIGEVDRINNWGNYIILKSDTGFYVELSHLMQHSLRVELGSYVEEGSVIAKCGNSGYSPEPHIHIQVQDVALLGGFTKKFVFSHYLQKEHLSFHSLPPYHSYVSGVLRDRSLVTFFTFILDDELVYDVYENNSKKEQIVFIVKMNTQGEFYFQDQNGNKLYFYNDAKEFYFYHYEGSQSYLKVLFCIAPRVPFISGKDIIFEDYLPLYLVKTRLQQIGTELLSTLNKNFYKYTCRYKLQSSCISSVMGKACLYKEYKGFGTIMYDAIELRRIK